MPSSAIAGCIQSSTTARQAIHLLIFFILHQWERTFFPVLPTFGLFLKTDNKNSILSIGSDNGRQIDPDKIVQFLSPHQNERGVNKQYVEKNLKGEASYYVTDSEFNYLRQLFRFNGIPHYQLVLKDGSISKEKLGTHRIRKYLEEHFPVSESAGQGENDQ